MNSKPKPKRETHESLEQRKSSPHTFSNSLPAKIVLGVVEAFLLLISCS
jgi:hypothetical protein